MDGEAIITVSAAVVALVQIVKWAGVSDTKGPLAVLVLSLLGVGVWAFDQRARFAEGVQIFEFFAGWIAVMTSAAGVYGFTRASSDKLTSMKGTGTGLGVVLLALVLGTGVVTAGCGATLPKIPNLPTAVELDKVEGGLLAVTGNSLELLTMTADAANTVSKMEDKAAKAGAVPSAADATFDKAMVEYANVSDAARKKLVDGSLKTWPEIRAVLEPVLLKGQAVIDAANSLRGMPSRFKSWVAAMRDTLLEIAGQFLVAKNFGGA